MRFLVLGFEDTFIFFSRKRLTSQKVAIFLLAG
jgi:hypothetical protein